MKQVDVIVGQDGNSPPVILDQYLTPFQVTYSVPPSGLVEVSITNPYPTQNGNFTNANFVWQSAPTSYPNATGFLGQPYRAIRVVGGIPGSTFTVIQAGVR